VSGIAAQFTTSKGFPNLDESWAIASAMSSLPVPVSPVIRTGTSTWAMRASFLQRSKISVERPTMAQVAAGTIVSLEMSMT
jgi:hypothetical protein